MREKIHLVFDYFNGPVCGVADCRGDLYFFNAPFLDGVDDYDKTFSLVSLTDEAKRFFAGAMNEDRSAKERDADQNSLFRLFKEAFDAKTGPFLRKTPNVICIKPGSDGIYEVDWDGG